MSMKHLNTLDNFILLTLSQSLGGWMPTAKIYEAVSIACDQGITTGRLFDRLEWLEAWNLVESKEIPTSIEDLPDRGGRDMRLIGLTKTGKRQVAEMKKRIWD